MPTAGELVLGASVVFAIFWEATVVASHPDKPAVLVPPALATLAALLYARRRAADLRPGVVVALSAGLYLAFFLVHASTDWIQDPDTQVLYPRYGQFLLDTGDLPAAEYPPGALLLFAGAKALGSVDTTLPLLALPLLLFAWWSLARTGPRATWLVACVALCPTIVAFWELKFDAAPTAIFVLGLLAAHRERWALAGLLLGAGAAIKWWPALAVVVLAIALVSRSQWRGAGRLALASLIAPILVYLPFLGDGTLTTPYDAQGLRSITGESLPYLPLRALGVLDRPTTAWRSPDAPGWVDSATVAVVAIALAAVCFAAWRRPRNGVLFACAAVLAFFLLNRIFSPQFLLPIGATLACGLALGGGAATAVRDRWFAILLVVGATANYAVWPMFFQHWEPVQAVLFAALTAATALMLVAAAPVRHPEETRSR